MNFLHLKYFLMVAEEKNITRAAERLFISQQSLSNHISNLEKELEVKLFTRSPKLSLTYAGELLVDTATQILDLQSQYLSKVGDINRQYMGVLRVGISYTCGLTLLPDVLPRFREEFPMVEFSLFEGNSSQMEDELAHGRVDLIICFQPIMLEGAEVIPLTEEKLFMVVPRRFTRQLFGDQAEEMRQEFTKNGADINVFRNLPFILLKRGNRVRSIVDRCLSRSDFKPKIILETENTITTKAMVKEDMGIIICPELFLRDIHLPNAHGKTPALDLFPLRGHTANLVAGYRQDRYLSHFAERFVEILKDVLTEHHLSQLPKTPAAGPENTGPAAE